MHAAGLVREVVLPVHSAEYGASILEGLGEGIVAFDCDGQVVVANACFVSLMGWEHRAVVGEAAAALLADRPGILRIVEDEFGGRRQAAHTDVVQHAPNGGLQNLRVCPSAFSSGTGRGVVLAVRDISDAKRTEREMLQVEKMSALGRLAASVAHEVRNPLGAIGIQLQLLEEDLSDLAPEFQGRIARRLNIAQTEMKRLDRIVRNFLRFSRTSRLRLQRLSFNEVVHRVFELVSPEAQEQGVRLELDLAPGLPAVDGDDSQLGQAVLNVIVNAFHAIDGSGEVRAKTWADETMDQVCLELADTGCGIPEDEIDRVFEFYYTTKGEGTGLGLSIAQRIIYQHGGHIELESQERVGTAFRIYLPISGARDE